MSLAARARMPPLSPRDHRAFDRWVALPGALAAAALLARRDPTAASLLLLVGAGEGVAQFTTDYPPAGGARWLTLRQHVRIANLHAGFIAALALCVPGVRPRHRALLLGVAAMPLVLNALTDVAAGD